jgi:hypothetical protein
MGWYESQQILNEERVPPTNTDLVFRALNIKTRMISEDNFRSQLISARNELNIPEEIYAESEKRIIDL